MSSKKLEIVIISPVYLPAPGGSGPYYSALASWLIRDDAVSKVTILTEIYPGSPKVENLLSGRIIVRRIFPFRAGNETKSPRVTFLYFIQNLLILTLPFRLRRRNTIIVVHGYFHNIPGAISIAAWMMRLFLDRTSKIVADLRDPLLPRWAFQTLKPYDHILCCAENVYDHISGNAMLVKKSRIIPIPFQIERPSDEKTESVITTYGLVRKKYIYSPNGIQIKKCINEILGMVEMLRERGSDLILVVAGKRRDWNTHHDVLSEKGVLKYIGNVPHEESLCLTAGAALVPVISPGVEGMPRSALEAIALGTRVLLPNDVPEFHKCCPNNIANWKTSDDLAELATRVLGEESEISYNISRHSYDQVMPMYKDLFDA